MTFTAACVVSVKTHISGWINNAPGMEFATEMIIKASLFKLKLAEVPITLHPDGRVQHGPHLRTFRDGWRTLRFLLIYSPRWLFLIPGAVLILFGLFGYGLALPGIRIRGVAFDAHTLLFATLSILCGYQAILFAIFTKTLRQRFDSEDPRLNSFFDLLTLERGSGHRPGFAFDWVRITVVFHQSVAHG